MDFIRKFIFCYSRPDKDGKVRKLCRKRSRSLKSWFEGREEPVQESYILLPKSKNNLESEDKIGKSFFLLITRNIFQLWKK